MTLAKLKFSDFTGDLIVAHLITTSLSAHSTLFLLRAIGTVAGG